MDVAILQQLNAFVSINYNGLLGLFDLASNKLLDQVKLGGDWFYSIATSGDVIAVGSEEAAFILNVVDGKLVLKFTIKAKYAYHCTMHGDRLFFTNEAVNITEVNIRTGETIR